MMILTLLLNLILPAKCAICGKLGSPLCPKCKIHLKPIDFPTCIICENLSVNGETHRKCLSKSTPVSFNSSYIYNHITSKILFKSKTGNKSYRYLNLLVNKSQAKQICEIYNINLITHVPYTQRKNRLIDHSRYIAEIVSDYTSIPQLKLISISRRSPEQKVSDKFSRIKNTQDKFTMHIKNADKISGKNILLIDDISTTGSSLLAASKTLLKHGANSVHCYTLVKAIRR